MPLIERSDHEGALVLTLNRPEKRNALNAALWKELHEALVEAREQSARCVVLAGAGKAFCGGGDVSEAVDADDAFFENICRLTHRAVEALYTLPCPTIALVHGAAIGAGLELALACDLRFAGESSFSISDSPGLPHRQKQSLQPCCRACWALSRPSAGFSAVSDGPVSRPGPWGW